MDYISSLYRIDFAILDAIAELQSIAADTMLGFITHLGDGGMIWIAAALVLLFFKKYRRCGVLMLTALALCAVLTSGVIKPLVGRPRPFVFAQIMPRIAPPGGFSFPSGHTSSSFTAAYSLFLCNRKMGAGALVLAVLIAFSRLYFYVHFPSDVLAGCLLGILCAFFVNRFVGRCLNKL